LDETLISEITAYSIFTLSKRQTKVRWISNVLSLCLQPSKSTTNFQWKKLPMHHILNMLYMITWEDNSKLNVAMDVLFILRLNVTLVCKIGLTLGYLLYSKSYVELCLVVNLTNYQHLKEMYLLLGLFHLSHWMWFKFQFVYKWIICMLDSHLHLNQNQS
jgi:hypothetical protein